MTETAPELKPCPFCGGEAKYQEQRGDNTNPYAWHVIHHCKTRGFIRIEPVKWYGDKAEVAALWNTRPEEARLKEGVTLIERAYYMEGKGKESRASTMNSIARDLQDDKDLAWARRLFPRGEAL